MVAATPEAKPEANPEAKPHLLAAAPLAYSAPLIASAPIVTASSSQSFVRNYNGVTFSAPLVAAAYTAYSPYVASPYAYSASPYAYSAYAAAAPLKYTAATTVLV